MARFVLTINTGNDGMISEIDISSALDRVSAEISEFGMIYRRAYLIRDINGHRVGEYSIQDVD